MQRGANDFLGTIGETIARNRPYIERARRFGALGLAPLGVLAAACGTIFVPLPWNVLLGVLVFGAAFVVHRMHEANRKIFVARQVAHGLLAIAEDCLKLLSLEGRIMCISEVGGQLIEADHADDLIGVDWLALWDGPDARRAFERAKAGESTSFSGACRTMNGTLKWWTSTFAPVYGEHGRVSAVLCKSRDITAERNLIDELRGNARVQKDMEDHVDAVFWTATRDFRELLHVSSAFERMWEMPMSALEADQTAWSQSVHPEDLPALRDEMRTAVNTGAATQSYFRLCLQHDRTRWVRADIYPVIEDGAVSRVVSVCVDATDERERLQELHRLANTDSLTGLANRNAMMDALVKRCEALAPFAYLFIDIDRFKSINDTAGHIAGDAVLRTIARRIAETLPDGAVAARPGGDEFTVILPGSFDQESIERACRKLSLACHRPIEIDCKSVTMTCSIGVALYPEHGRTPEALFISADMAMYAAKRAGRNTFRVFGDREKDDLARAHLEAQLHGAIREKEFVLHYQPQYRVDSGALVGVEALLRWNHPQLGLLGPGAFVPVLEESALIVEAGHWVIREAVQAGSQLALALPQACSVALNVSPKQFRDPRLVSVLRHAIRRAGIDSNRITLEITESALIDNVDDAQVVLSNVRAMGVRIAIDDFGTGYSSLSYLARFRPDVLKLDKSFVDNIATDAMVRTVVEGVIDLAHKLGVTVVAEGVETQEQLDTLRDVRCDKVQGFLLSRPVLLASLMMRTDAEDAATVR
ncbi:MULTISPECIES: EAL domain-containing protein [Caballeronia]|uniref:Diguanylate cyclase n=1 Tax=Caballeronia zhejiangensis TaxID=871203 RepID=A0A656QLH2_9BURK|nr:MULTISPECIES: EAL domain-containing protein [Caballeronia]EKS70196.1 PAS/PAC sensor-containing diguanylate cyclase/phosphodiesterase [Burkholderia sp. SJ98]KDR28872.1 diguanylate cyclase [Caballeronia zhejiangensis]MDR5790888.1 EAL domain-containing protein [Caballeronia sp. LP003]